MNANGSLASWRVLGSSRFSTHQALLLCWQVAVGGFVQFNQMSPGKKYSLVSALALTGSAVYWVTTHSGKAELDDRVTPLLVDRFLCITACHT